ncbi:hypothetical protein M2272_005169 [Mycobacterium frederiksbergense]|uniref:PE-PGRS family protein n=1 Tax=Mycolicibacterium frederiksbergense TaxID=117567 RepID=A0ABT6L6F7_9MYCO|nr:outer membrane porin GjpA [Mycolicibacterium frederiksbergense]MDH6198510.1 hypothetical protein [Mycolicibacterium frederiksbergense]
MNLALRPYVTAGVALVGASVIAATPVINTAPDIQSRAVSTAVELTALTDGLVDPWIEQFNTAAANATKLANAYFLAPGPALQQAIVNQAGYLNTILNNPASIGTVIQTISTNAQNVLKGLTYIGLDTGTFQLGRRLLQSNDYIHTVMAQYFPLYLPPDMDPQTVQLASRVVALLATPLSGVLIGLAGPIVSPAVALLNSVQAIAGELGTDPAAALHTLMATPANVVGAFFNGATLDLSAVLPLVNGSMPEGTSIDALSVAFGGLLTAGTTAQSPAGESPIGGPGSIGGSILNSVGITVTRTDIFGNPSTQVISGHPVGPLGALAKLSQIVAKELGWNGKGNPLTNLKFPEIDQGTATDATTDSAPRTAISSTGTAETRQLQSADTVSSRGTTDLSAGIKAIPGKAGATSATSKPAAKAASDIGERVSSTVNKIGEGIKTAIAKPEKKSTTASTDTDKGAGAAGDTK